MNEKNLVIVAFLQNATIEYSLESLCACVCVCVCVFVCVCVCVFVLFLYMKITVGQIRYWALSDQGQGHGATFSPFTAIQTVRSHYLTLVQARKLILSVYVYLRIIYKFYKYCHS